LIGRYFEPCSHNKFRIGIKKNHWKSRAIFAKIPRGYLTGGGRIFSRNVCSPPQQFKFQLNILYLFYFMI
jgi:hypothetical protein